MAIINYSPWTDAANAGQGLGASLTNLMLELPKLRQQQQLLEMHRQLYGAETQEVLARIPVHQAQADEFKAHSSLYGAEQKHYEAQTGVITSAENSKDDLGNAFLNIAHAQQTGQPIGDHVAMALNALARLPHSDRASLAETLAQMLEMDKPAARQAMAVGNRTFGHPMNVGPGSTLVNSITGAPMYESPRVLGYGQELKAPETGETLATGRDRPLSDVIHSAVSGAIARAYFNPDIMASERTNILRSIPDFLGALPGAGMPTDAPPIIPGRKGASAPVNPKAASVNPRYNPATGRVEKFNPTTGQWE